MLYQPGEKVITVFSIIGYGQDDIDEFLLRIRQLYSING
jgi:hypothetical protein